MAFSFIRVFSELFCISHLSFVVRSLSRSENFRLRMNAKCSGSECSVALLLIMTICRQVVVAVVEVHSSESSTQWPASEHAINNSGGGFGGINGRQTPVTS